MKLYTEQEILKRLRDFHTDEINLQLFMEKMERFKFRQVAFDIFKAGQDSKEDNGRGFIQFYQKTYRDKK
jgi:hypothetical protein